MAQICNADGTVDPATFSLAPGVLTVDQLHLSTMADGRVAVRYATDAFGNDQAFVQIIDPPLAAVALTGTTMGDQLQGTGFADSINGGDGRDKLAGMAGDDLLTGGAQTDSLMGGLGNDTLVGGADVDQLQGGLTNDVLIGGFGNDVLSGGLGRDSFVFATKAGQDRVLDFTLGQDTLDLRAYHFATAALALTHVTQGAEGAVFQMGVDSVLLVGVDAAALGAGSLVL
jgi:Ca2+-binding RTX toxin-like protein